MIERKENWPTLLSEFLAERAKETFEWGKNDCMLFCSDCVFTLTGYDPAYDIRGKYDNKIGALKVIDGFGDDVSEIINARIGQSKPVKMAMRGDVVTLMNDGRICGGIVDESGKRAAFVSEKGLLRIPLRDCIKAWGY